MLANIQTVNTIQCRWQYVGIDYTAGTTDECANYTSFMERDLAMYKNSL